MPSLAVWLLLAAALLGVVATAVVAARAVRAAGARAASLNDLVASRRPAIETAAAEASARVAPLHQGSRQLQGSVAGLQGALAVMRLLWLDAGDGAAPLRALRRVLRP